MRKKIEAIMAGGKAIKNLFTGGGKNPNPGQAIKSVKTNVPETKLEKLKARNVIGGGRLKGAQAKLKQTMFEIKNPKFAEGKLTFDPARKNVPKKSDLKKKKSFPDLNKDGKVTFADVLKGRGVKAKA